MDDFDFDVTLTQTPAKSHLTIPPGHIIVASKWRNSTLINSMQGNVQILFQEDLGLVDFYLSSQSGVVFVTEAELVTDSGYKRKLAKLRKANKMQVIVLIEKTATSAQYFSSAQRFCMMDLGFSIIPVPSQREAGTFLAQLVLGKGQRDNNPFLKKSKTPSLDQALLTTVQSIPKLGSIKAKALLENFQNIHGICQASIEELTQVVGKASAQHVVTFFRGSQK